MYYFQSELSKRCKIISRYRLLHHLAAYMVQSRSTVLSFLLCTDIKITVICRKNIELGFLFRCQYIHLFLKAVSYKTQGQYIPQGNLQSRYILIIQAGKHIGA